MKKGAFPNENALLKLLYLRITAGNKPQASKREKDSQCSENSGENSKERCNETAVE